MSCTTLVNAQTDRQLSTGYTISLAIQLSQKLTTDWADSYIISLLGCQIAFLAAFPLPASVDIQSCNTIMSSTTKYKTLKRLVHYCMSLFTT